MPWLGCWGRRGAARHLLEVGQGLTSSELPGLGTDLVHVYVCWGGGITQKAAGNQNNSLSDKDVNVSCTPELPGDAHG